MLESQLQSKIIRLLEKDSWYVIKIIQSNKNGIPDLICHRQGRTVYIEVKRQGQKARPLQQYRIDQLKAQIVEAYVIDNIEELTNYGLI